MHALKNCVNQIAVNSSPQICPVYLAMTNFDGYTVFVFNQATQVNSAFHPSGVGKSSTDLLGWGEGGASSPVSSGR